MKCEMISHRPEREATGYVRRVRRIDGEEKVIGPYCDDCQAAVCVSLRATGDYTQVGAVPLDYRERMAGAKREGIKRRITDEILHHPGGPSEIADDLFNLMAHLGADYTVPALLDLVGERIARWQMEQVEGKATMAAEIDPKGMAT